MIHRWKTSNNSESARKKHPTGASRFILLVTMSLLSAHTGSAQPTAYATLYSFKGNPDGTKPIGGVIVGKDGSLYGTTDSGGLSSSGTVFQLIPSTEVPWTEKVLHSFTGSDGAGPRGNLVVDSTGRIYGVTKSGGSGSGTIFELAPSSTPGDSPTETVLYTYDSFTTQNHTPNGPVLIGPGGTLYTTTRGYGVYPAGTADILVPPTAPGGAWTGSVIYSFGLSSGSLPFAGVVFKDGSLFGTNYFGGTQNCNFDGCGAVYELTPPTTPGGRWTETTIHAFAGPPTDGAYSEAALTVGAGGTLYGTTTYGGSGKPCSFNNGGCGTVFQLTPPSAPGDTWTYSVIYNFTGVNGDGAYPVASVTVGKNGLLYGTTQYGGSATSGSPCTFYGASGCGTVFQLTPPTTAGGSWSEKVLHSFTGQNGDGSLPTASLAWSSAGVLYGTTSEGGTSGRGTVFALKP